MHVIAPETDNDALTDAVDGNFAVGRSQWFGVGALLVLLIALAVILFRNADNSVNDLKSLSKNANTTSNLVSTQLESLQYASSFERWISGTTTRNNLEIRRGELAQNLKQLDDIDLPTDKRLTPEYLSSLMSLDSYLIGTPSGFLSTDDQIALRSSSEGDLKMFILLSRQIAGPDADGNADPLTTLFQNEIVRQNSRNAALLVAIALIFLIAGFIAFTYLRNLKRIRSQMETERQKLDESNVALKQIDNELQMRLDQDRIDRAENEWINTTARSISLEFKSTILPGAIAESLVEGLGKALGVDVVLFYSFAKHPMPRLWKQWHLKDDPEVEESVITDYEPELLRLMEHLWNRKRKIIVNDSQLIDISKDPIPELAAITQMGARSWMMVPVGAGTQVLGSVAVGMVENPRVWSDSEIELVEKVVAEVADVFIQARLFSQSMQIAENDAEVNRLVELDTIKNDVIENINHELRTPLTSIIGYLEVIVDDVDAGSDPELASS
ncbi:MAG: GAF domain-containing protein, partial [Ilumatobacteraceae bacterium]